jgi:hypothetical protein
MAKNEFCPASCLFDPDSPNLGVAAQCLRCWHSADEKFINPYPAHIFKRGVTVVGRNGGSLYVREQGALSLVDESQVDRNFK